MDLNITWHFNWPLWPHDMSKWVTSSWPFVININFLLLRKKKRLWGWNSIFVYCLYFENSRNCKYFYKWNERNPCEKYSYISQVVKCSEKTLSNLILNNVGKYFLNMWINCYIIYILLTSHDILFILYTIFIYQIYIIKVIFWLS